MKVKVKTVFHPLSENTNMNNIDIDQLIQHFYNKGGSVSDVYLNSPDVATSVHSASIVLLNGKPHVGDTTRKAIIKALKTISG